MKQTIEKAFEESWLNDYYHGNYKGHDQVDFYAGAKWQSQQSYWISVEVRLPEENENIIIMCEHGAIFNGAYCNGVWFCMDGYIHDSCNDNPIYSSMCSIPPLWKPTHWMPIPALPKGGEE